jgi:hypothetical protein
MPLRWAGLRVANPARRSQAWRGLSFQALPAAHKRPPLTVQPRAGICDEIGVELPSIQAARAEAARSLADIARDMSPDDRREVVVEVSDEEGCPIFRAAFYFEIEDLAPSTL